ncbi:MULTISPECIES: DoxX family protein [unclassified Amycolatopsis]|uniref:DoxX family protein n=1 Tax=unclassified Amycolatopsis TaxID=2618356 RepID=UPI001C6A2BA7|nr:DoxX family protein [Amycolatopsis sp. DSM 110486]QYN16546.1 DoxX family protein [Amycolatopsis sp. DSM 110486]
MTSQGDDYQSGLLSGVGDTTNDNDDEVRQGGLGLGLLILRLGLAAIVGAHGLQHLFGAFGGPGITGFAHLLETFGFHKQTTLLSWVTGIVEVGGSALLLVGLFTPLAAAGILGVAASAVFAKFHGGFFEGDGRGWEFELLIGVVALALIFTGAGRISLERNTPWRKRPLPLGVVSLLLAAAASVVVIVLTR